MYNFMTKRVTYSRRYHTVITHVIKEPLTADVLRQYGNKNKKTNEKY